MKPTLAATEEPPPGLAARGEPCGPPAQGFRLGTWWVDPASGELSRPGERRRLQPQPMELLAYLAANPGRLVTKEELLAAIWQGAAVEEHALPRCVSELRGALGDDARSPSYIETFPRRGYRLVARPEAGDPRPLDRRPGSHPRRLGKAVGLTLGAAALLSLAALLALELLDGPARTERIPLGGGLAAAPRTPSLAILGFEDRSGDEALRWLETALPSLLANELALAEGIRVVPPELVTSLLDELSLPGVRPPDVSALGRIHKALGADLLVVGSFGPSAASDGGALRMELVVLGAGHREPVTQLVQEGPAAQATELAALLAARLREAVAAGTPPAPGGEAPAGVLARDPAALRLYYEGLRRLRRFEAPAARVHLERSLAEEPEQPLALLALSQAWMGLGSRARAAELADQALALAAALPRAERLAIEAHALAVSGRWDAAVELYAGLWQRSPGTLEIGIRLARSQLEAQLPGEAQATVAEIRRRAGPSYGDPRLDLLEAGAARDLADHERALAAARRAARMGAVMGAELVVAHGRSIEGAVLRSLGRVQESRAAQEAAALLFAAAGDYPNEAWARLRLAGWAHDAGEFSHAEAIYRETLAAFRKCGDAAGEAQVGLQMAGLAQDLNDLAQAESWARGALATIRQLGERVREADALSQLARIRAMQGRQDEATSFLEEALSIRREAGSPELVAMSLSNLGRLYLFQGRLAAAQAKLREGADLARGADLPDLLATIQFNLGYLLAEVGDLGAAEAALAQAEGLFRRLENRRMAGASLQGLGEVLLMRADLPGARAKLEAALDLRLAMGEAFRIAESRRALVDLLLEEGDPEGAGRMAEEAKAAARAAGAPAIVTARFAEALLAQGKVGAALAVVVDVGPAEQRKGPATLNDFTWRTVAARIWEAQGRLAEARAELAAVVREAEAVGAWRTASEAGLALAESELRAGAGAAASARLEKLEAEARARGYLLLARKAMAAASAVAPRSVAQRLARQRPH